MRVRVPRPAPGQVWPGIDKVKIAGWSSQEARRAHNPKVAGSNPAPATNFGGIAQMARARGSYPRCHWFDSSCRHQKRIRLRPIESKNRSKERIFLFLTRLICPCSSRGVLVVVPSSRTPKGERRVPVKFQRMRRFSSCRAGLYLPVKPCADASHHKIRTTSALPAIRAHAHTRSGRCPRTARHRRSIKMSSNARPRPPADAYPSAPKPARKLTALVRVGYLRLTSPHSVSPPLSFAGRGRILSIFRTYKEGVP